ncbi:hypothetical protein [Marinobacterium litorale]|uniref:hypothetical protein n=1 Tax=Marinobacterium litorale TaxID=404770 RepID=UPI00048599BD|nr:hypothetical protein [Marinobacterium litorale]
MYKPPVLEGTKALRAEESLNQTVTVDGFTFQTDEESMDRMDRVVDIANWKFNQAVAQGATATEAYNAVYLGNTVPWKTADNNMGQFTIELICRVQEQALNLLGETWVKYG